MLQTMTKQLELLKKEVKRQIEEKGYAICPNVLKPNEIKERIAEVESVAKNNSRSRSNSQHGRPARNIQTS